MWITKKFKTKDKRDAWITKNKHQYQIAEIYVNNSYALDVRRLRVM